MKPFQERDLLGRFECKCIMSRISPCHTNMTDHIEWISFIMVCLEEGAQLETEHLHIVFNPERLIFQPLFCWKGWCSVFCVLFLSFALWRNVRSCFHFQQRLLSLYLAYHIYFIRKVGVYMISYLCAYMSASNNNIWTSRQDPSSSLSG
jgi:hypothetical protein